MSTTKVLAIALGGFIAAIGLVGMVAPSVLLEFGRSLQTPCALYAVGAARVALGALLVSVASVSRIPGTLRVVGVVIIVAGLLTPFIDVEHAQAMLAWWSSVGEGFRRAWAGVVVVLGLGVIYVVVSPRRAGT